MMRIMTYERSTLVNREKYIGLDVHQATISVAVLDSKGKLAMESILETQAAAIPEFKESVCHLHLRFALGRRFESRHLHYPDARTVRRRGVVAARGIDRFVLGNVPVQIDHPRSESSPCA
jgi:hypothetical protein